MPPSKFLREFLNNTSLSMYRLSKETGISEALLSRFKNGTRGLSMENVDKLFVYFNLYCSEYAHN